MLKRTVLAALLVATVALGGGALAQTGQGGYLGSNPGADTGPPKPPSEADMMTKPMAFCMRNGLDPGRCMGRAQSDHDYCMSKGREQYFTCRRNMDAIGWHN